MNVPRRLIEEGTEFEREILASSRLDVGTDRGFKRTLGAMGLATATVSATSSTAGAGTAAGALAGSTATLLGGVGVGAIVKWIGLATLLVGGATLSVTWVGHRAPAVADPVQEVALSRAMSAAPATPKPSVEEIKTKGTPPSSPAPESRIPTPTASPTPATAPLRRAEPHTPAPPPPFGAAAAESRVSESAPASGPKVESARADPAGPVDLSPKSLRVPSPSTLDGEVAALDQVRSSLSAGDPQSALRQLDAYDRACHVCILTDEATVLRVDASLAQGDAAAAASLAQRFLATNPSSPHAPHLRHVIAGTQTP